ncbi:plasmid partitioning protein RepB [Paenirhodobacter enshiensis]|uniref:Rep B partitioning protein/ParB n=1 Tax=Paenirhodobacter enshiensis TaxID=1105367 RepID=A0A086XR03_9RHOB|nr:plasmid partitioning protein RepB [Paenirhodobacter enshiensis]KFI24453.1 Rep B partitioning protein/ParB [Paenirhodobacter enshiensis]
MTDSKKKRLSMLDQLTPSAVPAPSMMSTNRALRAARDAVDTHRIWEIDPKDIADNRISDRLDPGDLAELRASIETNGQAVPILVRRDPQDQNRYLLVYGRRRLEAIRGSEKIGTVRALIANMNDDDAVRAQVAENTARQDLSFIERALFARDLLNDSFGTQAQVAEVLSVTRSMISMLLSIAESIGPDLARAIGPAPGIGRPRWEALAADLAATGLPREALIETAVQARAGAPEGADPSVVAFEAVSKQLRKALSVPRVPAPGTETTQALTLNGKTAGKVIRTKQGVKLDLRLAETEFADWLAAQAQDLIAELNQRWKAQNRN